MSDQDRMAWVRPGGFRRHGWGAHSPRPWRDLADLFAQTATRYDAATCLAEIVDSIIDSGVADQLSGSAGAHNNALIVVEAGDVTPPLTALVVSVWQGGPDTAYKDVGPEQVAIEHWAATGHNDRVERPVSEALPLFRRFVAEKFGIEVPRDPVDDEP